MISAVKMEKDERRKAPRYMFSRYIFYATENSFHEGELKDYSHSGLFIKTSYPLPVGEVVTVALPYSDDLNDKRKAQVVWRNDEGFGVEFFKNIDDRVTRADIISM